MTFTFVNTVDAPSLSASSAKAMRAHVTKTNFANRRKRIATENGSRRKARHEGDSLSQFRVLLELQGQLQVMPTEEKNDEMKNSESFQPVKRVRRSRQKKARNVKLPVEESPSQVVEKRSPLMTSRPSDPYITVAYLAQNFCPIIFGSEETLNEVPSWIGVLVHEPAFSEATLALGVSSRSTDSEYSGFSTPEGHLGKAISLVNARLSDPHTAVSDGVLAAVFIFAVWEKLKGPNDVLWGIHVDGLAKMLTVRRDRGGERLPDWLIDGFLYYGFSVSTLEQKQRYQKVLDAIALSWDGRAAINVPLTYMYMTQMVRGIERYRHFDLTPDLIEREIEKPIDGLYDIADRLKVHSHLFLRALGFAIIAFVGLSWPKSTMGAPEVSARDLRNTLQRTIVRPCSTKLLIWQLMTGGVAAGSHSKDRGWFVLGLATIIRTMRPTSWADILMFLQRAFMPDAVLLEKMKAVWDEAQTQAHKGTARESPLQGTAIADEVYP